MNRIDMEFNDDEDKPVRDAWTVYLDHLNTGEQAPQVPAPDSDEQTRKAYQKEYEKFQGRQEAWAKDSRDKLAKLLSAMGQPLGYNFDEVKIKKAAYRPQRHDDIEQAQLYLLAVAGQVFSGQQPLAMFVQNWPAPNDEQLALAHALLDAVQDGAVNTRQVPEPQN